MNAPIKLQLSPFAVALLALTATAASHAGTRYEFRSPANFTVATAGPASPAALTMALTPEGLPSVMKGIPVQFDFNALLVIESGSTGTDSVRWALTGGELPPGLTLDTASGTMSGTPTAEGGYTFEIEAKLGAAVARQSYSLSTHFTDFMLSACSVTSANDRFGPTAAECSSAYASYPEFSNQDVFSIGTGAANKGYQYWTVPAAGTYEIVLAGAQGGDGMAYDTFKRGGFGAVVKANLELNEGSVLTFIVGKKPLTVARRSAGGGGGSFLVVGSSLVLAAGGGGGGATSQGLDASTLLPGTSSAGGGLNGDFGGGGAGFSGRGASRSGYVTGGSHFAVGFAGGVSLSSTGSGQGHGGFGGGGGACACSTGNGGNGGGYGGGSGGDGGPYSYGGGAAGTSFLGATGSFTGELNEGSGWARVRKLN